MTEAEVVRLLGRPTSTQDAILTYRQDDRDTVSRAEGNAVAGDYASVGIELKDDHVYAVRVERSNML